MISGLQHRQDLLGNLYGELYVGLDGYLTSAQ